MGMKPGELDEGASNRTLKSGFATVPLADPPPRPPLEPGWLKGGLNKGIAFDAKARVDCP
ncbi:hypothetical protein [Vulcanisaeta distributa]|uniref:hypothetical protein n=1 Tax=Vulcanisaeta distributa TaxID=164451 RepID=UPI001FB2A813|nr:hypothetical protein [Vulcanisaeta distributa]